MRQTLRRACAACARTKHSCDLGTPRCSRCTRRKVQCLYANEPLTASRARTSSTDLTHARGPSLPNYYGLASFDPFDTYPPTRLPRPQVERLIHSFLNEIVFQYYPLDLNTSNPFLVSWWPLALGDPALFHVSLQTACLNEEFRARKGFQASEMLMADSVALLRRKVGDAALAVEDGTMNSVITLAAIEFGKGNVETTEMHVHGVKRLVQLRGGIHQVRRTSPLTARMVSWVSMLVMGHPQFEAQDDAGTGDGIPPIPEWQLGIDGVDQDISELGFDMDADVENVFVRLRHIFRRAEQTPLPPTRLHDMICFVLHRLLTPSTGLSHQRDPTTECIRYAIVLYLFITQGPTYYTHAVLFNTIVSRLVESLTNLSSLPRARGSLDVWLLAIGIVASNGTTHRQWFAEQIRSLAALLRITCWEDALLHIRRILWLETPHAESLFRPHWDAAVNIACPLPLQHHQPALTKYDLLG